MHKLLKQTLIKITFNCSALTKVPSSEFFDIFNALHLTGHLNESIAARMLLEYLEDVPTQQIASKYKLSMRTVHRFIQRYVDMIVVTLMENANIDAHYNDIVQCRYKVTQDYS